MKYFKNSNNYIFFFFTSIFLFLGLNSFFYIMKDALGYGGGTFLFTSADRFADIIKTSLSYKDVLLKIPNFNHSIDNLSPIYQNYFYHNPYGGLSAIEGTTHFHLMPISTLLNIIVGIAIGYGFTPRLIMFILFFFCIFLIFSSAYNIVKSYKKSLLIVALVVFSYPFLMIVTRGNYSAFFCGIGVLAFLNSLFINKKIDFYSLFLFSIAINFRPNAAILLIAIPFFFGLSKSFWPIIKVALVSFIIYVVTYFIVNTIYPDYTLNSFFKALSVYNKLYVIGSGGDSFNSSLYGAIKIFGKLIGLNIGIITLIFYALSVLILLALVRLFFKGNSNSEYFPFIFSSIYILINPVSADYHLLVFILPIFIIYNNYDLWQKNEDVLLIITISTLLLLIPKNYLTIKGISPQVIINPMIMFFTLIYLFYKNQTKNNPDDIL